MVKMVKEYPYLDMYTLCPWYIRYDLCPASNYYEQRFWEIMRQQVIEEFIKLCIILLVYRVLKPVSNFHEDVFALGEIFLKSLIND